MHEAEVLIEFHQGFRGAQKEIAAEVQVAEEMVDGFRF